MANEINEYTLGDDIPVQPWHDHDWTVQEINFVTEYLRSGNKSAAFRAYSKPNQPAFGYATLGADKLLAKPWMGAYIEECRQALRQRMAITKENVLEEIAKMAFANLADFTTIEDGATFTDLSGVTREQLAAISELTIETYAMGSGENKDREVKQVKIKLAPKLVALELLGKHHKLFTDVVENGSIADIAAEMREARQARQRRLKGNDSDGPHADDAEQNGEGAD